MVANLIDQISEDIVETIHEPLLVLDSDLKVILANLSFIDLFKVTREETLGRFIYDIGNKQWDIPKLRELLETILPEKISFDNYEVVHDFATIGRRVMLLNARKIERKVGQEPTILLAIEDITERKLLEDQLEESEVRYRRLFETASDGVLLLEKHEGHISRANPATTNLLGYSEDEITGKALKDVGFPDDFETIQEIVQTLEKDGIIHHKDTPLKKKNGQFVDTDIYMVDKAILIQCNIRDITERKRVEEALRENSARTQAITDSAQDAIIMMGPEGEISYWNPMAESIFGYTADEVMGQNLHNLLAPESYHEAYTKSFPAFQKTGQGNVVGQTIKKFKLLPGGRLI